jgi:putative ABC transport system permease protein
MSSGDTCSALTHGGRLSSLFGLVGLALAAIGIFGVIAHSVNQRSREIGRIALGASRRDVLALVVRQGMGLVLAGVAAGLAGAWVAVRLLAHLLLRVNMKVPGDPPTCSRRPAGDYAARVES